MYKTEEDLKKLIPKWIDLYSTIQSGEDKDIEKKVRQFEKLDFRLANVKVKCVGCAEYKENVDCYHNFSEGEAFYTPSRDWCFICNECLALEAEELADAIGLSQVNSMFYNPNINEFN